MNVNTADIDRIVREVLSRLAPAGSAAPTTALVPPAAPAPGSLALSGKVVTAADLEGRLEGIKTVLLTPRAVVTPAARDLLRQRGVTLASHLPAAGSTTKPSGAALVLGVAETNFEPAALAQALSQEGAAVERIARTGLAGVVQELSDQAARGGKLALLLTGRPLSAVALANRQRGVRAACAADTATVGRAIHEIGVNFLAVDPAGASFFALRQIVRAFVRGGPRSCPPELQTNSK